ncbi:hypothetical protein EJ04DRAFT_449992 [Polyplosphaeria fusca]|uniref:DJ-1/PfpI domain-containing protein n=1 Tax=Polyplosphaeria fusca TaxID=682080 RepID=A0A9P4QNI8_9PLEO|nr:hypothetical protein EJ04DRAFT_449992 [Polyplosphaeria fusca]
MKLLFATLLLAVIPSTTSFNLSNPNRPIEAGVILLGVTEVLDVAPMDYLHGISTRIAYALPVPDKLKAKFLDINFHWITEKGEPGKLTTNLTLAATDSFETSPPLDIVLIGAYNIEYKPNAAELAFIRKAHDESSAFITICGGYLAAQLAGVLVNKTATAPRFNVPELQKSDPRTNWVEKRYVRDGKVWTSGALLNGLDLMRGFTAEYWPELASVGVQIGAWPVRDGQYQGTDGLPNPNW